MFYFIHQTNKAHCLTIACNILFTYKIFDCAVERIPAIGNKAEIDFSSKTHLHYSSCS